VPNSQEEVRLSEISEVTPIESPSTLYRLNRTSILNVTADVDKEIANVPLVLADVAQYLDELLQQYPNINYRFDGEAEDSKETNNQLMVGLILVILAIYALLAIPFKSYGQPLIVMSVIPFGIIGAIIGHVLIGVDLSTFSLFGMLALVGVMVNDSLVMVDYINKARLRGMELMDAVLTAAAIRFRPVILTSVTTFAGLTPILIDGSQQAQFLKPMAASLAFGIIFATVITLIIVPVNYIAARNFKYAVKNAAATVGTAALDYWNKEDPKRIQ